MQEEVTQKTVTFCIRATKITADLLKKVLVAYLRHQKQKSVEKKAQKNQPKQGKVTVKELAKQNAGMVNIEIMDKNIKSFERYARKYGINYALKKDKSKEPPVYLVFFKGRDQDALNGLYAREDIVHPDGATGTIYKAGEQVASLTTDDKGQASVNGLYLGKYYFKEITPPTGYLADAEEHDLTCSYEGDMTAEVKRECTSSEQVIKQPFPTVIRTHQSLLMMRNGRMPVRK